MALKNYSLSFVDGKGNELKRDEIKAFDIKEARSLRDRIFGECMLNDCRKILVRRIYE